MLRDVDYSSEVYRKKCVDCVTDLAWRSEALLSRHSHSWMCNVAEREYFKQGQSISKLMFIVFCNAKWTREY